MKIQKLIVLIGGMTVLAACQTTSAPSETLYDKLGGNESVTLVVHDTLEALINDKRTAHTFEHSNVERVETLIIEQICNISGGPCEYTGQTMERSHRGLGINSMHFNVMVEYMQKAMDKQRIPYRVQNQLLALLAPMHDDVVGR